MEESVIVQGNLGSITLGVVLVVAQALEIYVMFGPIESIDSLAISAKSTVKQWVSNFLVLVQNLQQVIQDFQNGKFYKPWGRTKAVIIRNPNHMQELSEAPQLSQRAVFADIFGFKHNMKNKKIVMDPTEQTAARYRLFARAIKLNGRAQMAALQPFLQVWLEQSLSQALESRCQVDGWYTLRLAPLMSNVVSGMLGVYMFGAALMKETEFSSAAFQFYEDVMKSMAAQQLLPGLLRPAAHTLMTRDGKAFNILFNRLCAIFASHKGSWDEDENLKSMTLLYNMRAGSVDSSYWTPEQLAQAIIGIWFAASHQPWMNLHFIILELCQRPEYLSLIRKEIEEQESMEYSILAKLPILDSFIKESVRLNPLDEMSIRRKALQPYTFSNGGPSLSIGEVACVSGWDILHDETKYPNAGTFDGLRFVKQPSSGAQHTQSEHMKGTIFTDASKDFPIWGLGSHVCSGRWHGDLVLKLTLVHLVTYYDFRLEDPDASHRWFWESWQMPYKSTKLSLRKRST